jgi:hypothetical protein
VVNLANGIPCAAAGATDHLDHTGRRGTRC